MQADALESLHRQLAAAEAALREATALNKRLAAGAHQDHWQHHEADAVPADHGQQVRVRRRSQPAWCSRCVRCGDVVARCAGAPCMQVVDLGACCAALRAERDEARASAEFAARERDAVGDACGAPACSLLSGCGTGLMLLLLAPGQRWRAADQG